MRNFKLSLTPYNTILDDDSPFTSPLFVISDKVFTCLVDCIIREVHKHVVLETECNTYCMHLLYVLTVYILTVCTYCTYCMHVLYVLTVLPLVGS